MASLAAALSQALPKPNYTGEDEELPTRASQRGPRIVGPGHLDDTQIVLKRAGGPPPYGQRTGWRPRNPEDFGDGGAFPEIHVAQYPLDMGRKGGSSTKSNALALTVDGDGKVKYDAIARQGHAADRIVQTSFKDLIPLRQRADAGEINLERPSEEEVAATTERTKAALERLVSGAVASQKPKIVERQKDPMEPPKFRIKKIPRGPPSPPPPVMRSPPRKLTAQDQEDWRIPPPVSNWKNPKGFTVPLDKRLAADGRGLQDVQINDKFAQFSEALFMADRHAREEVKQRALMQQRLAEKEKQQKEEHLRMLAQQAREEKAGHGRRRSRSGSYDSRSSAGSSYDSDESAVREREEARKERRREEERKLRQSRMGAERRVQVMAREQNRDISEKIALGLAKPTQSKEGMYDSRLFNQSSGFDSGFNEDNPYDKPLFAAQDAISSIYRPSVNMDDDDETAGDQEMEKIQKSSRFGEALGRGKFKGTEDAEAREGPVQFEKETVDPFNVDKFLSEVEQSSGKRGYGLQETDDRKSKRPRVEDDDDDDE
jgi:SNW domain-containing protein 1